MNTKDQTISIEKLAKMEDTKKLNFDLKIQRSEGIWDKPRRSKLMHSVIINWPIGQLYATKDNTIYGIIDGKQRCTNILAYIADKYALDASTPPVGDIVIAGRKFSELPAEIQQAIMKYELKFTTLENATVEEKEEFFKRINAGMPLRQIETTRAALGGKELKLVEDIANAPFFSQTLKLNKQRYTDQELVLQILALIHNENTSFGGKDIEKLVIQLRETKRLNDELKNKMANACYYLNNAFLKREKFLKKVNIPMIFFQVLKLQENALNIAPQEFEEWAKNFFANVPDEYDLAIKEGSGKPAKIKKRIEVMGNHFDAYFAQKEHESQKAQDETQGDDPGKSPEGATDGGSGKAQGGTPPKPSDKASSKAKNAAKPGTPSEHTEKNETA